MTAVQISNATSDGTTLGQSASDKIAFYGATPVAQRGAAVQATSLLSASSYVSVASNTAAIFLEIANTLIGVGLWKGST